MKYIAPLFVALLLAACGNKAADSVSEPLTLLFLPALYAAWYKVRKSA